MPGQTEKKFDFLDGKRGLSPFSFWRVGGSQELDSGRVKLGDAVITIESETYMGLTIEGPRSIVEALVQEVSEHLRSG